MKCYICEKQPGAGGTHFHVREAVGVCRNCGVAVCAEHSYRAAEPGSPLLCPSCARLMKDRAVNTVVQVAVPH